MLRWLMLSPALLMLAAAAPAGAHHTFVSKYDGAKTVHVSGVVTQVSFANPHIHFTVQAGKGNWTVETESISVVTGKGITRAALKEGAQVTLSGWPARDGSAQIGLKHLSIQGGPSATLRGTAR